MINSNEVNKFIKHLNSSRVSIISYARRIETSLLSVVSLFVVCHNLLVDGTDESIALLHAGRCLRAAAELALVVSPTGVFDSASALGVHEAHLRTRREQKFVVEAVSFGVLFSTLRAEVRVSLGGFHAGLIAL
jgi:hypothetical protein